ncbi:MAG: hypothetical protein LBC87_05185 [Fibromonadaceae bacterium]|jgi:hypothetical protein|nr:hypothetical protein [Fibromonadaceae bacterium]
MKRGISLIAVLMFMLAATTASVVIFRIIGSENFSSGARLKASEAYQASESGIDYVRSWMENKAADAGALVTQYYEAGGKQPIKIFKDEIVINDKQKFSAFLIGIDSTAKPVLKLKVLVEGNARDSSKVFQTAILSTDGLYKVFMPDEIERQKSNPPPPDDYFGSSVEFQGEKEFSSATINGNWTGNPPKITGNFIVTGNLQNSGNSVDIGNNACVGGNYSSNNDKVSIKGGLYMGSSSEFVGTTGSYNDVYCEGDLRFGTNGKGEMIKGSLTINGKISGFNGGRRYRVDGSLVLGDTVPSTAYIDGAGLESDNNSFVVCDNVWTANAAGVRATAAQGEKIHFNYGKTPDDGCSYKPNATLFFKSAARTIADNLPNLEWKTQPNPPVGYFKSKNLTNTEPNLSPSNKPAGASSIKEYCMKILGEPQPGSGCDGSKYKVNDPIVSSLASIKEFLAAKADTSSIKYNDFVCLSNKEALVISGGVIKEHGSKDFGWQSSYILPTVLNDCYNKLKDKPNMLYGGVGGYLVVKLNQDQLYTLNTPLKGKFIFIYEKPQKIVSIAPTTNTSKVMIFFEKGIHIGVSDGEMVSAGCVSNNDVCNDDNKGGFCKYNYFIYSLEDINKANSWDKRCPLEGNVFFPSSTCARLVKADNDFSLKKNENELFRDLVDMGILCERKAGINSDDCKDHVEPPPPPPPPGSVPGESDNIWIPIASRLPIKLETKEIRKETLQGKLDDLKASIIVMPRVIRLAPNQITVNDPSKLINYYELLYLNGATTISPKPIPTTCDGDITKYDASKKGRYKCTFSNKDISPFYVIVKKIGN